MQIVINWIYLLGNLNLRHFDRSSGYKDCPRGCCTQPEEVKIALRELLVHMPVAMIFISLIFLYMHPINEKTRKNNKLILEEMR